MKVQSVDYIITNKHYSLQEGADGSMRGYLLKMVDTIRKQRGVRIEMHIDDAPSGPPVLARIWQGQWIGDCECGGALFVNPDEPIYFCFGCANRENKYNLRPVVFPPEAERLEIERLILERPVNDIAGLTDLERVGLAKPILFQEVKQSDGSIVTLGLARNWIPGETVADLKKQNQLVDKWRSELKNGNNVKRRKS